MCIYLQTSNRKTNRLCLTMTLLFRTSMEQQWQGQQRTPSHGSYGVTNLHKPPDSPSDPHLYMEVPVPDNHLL